METMAISRERIKALREAKAWSQAHLAEAAGLSLRTVQRMEAEGTASGETRLAVAAALGVPVEALNPAAPPPPAPVIEPEPDDDGAPGKLLVLAVSGVGVLFALWLGGRLPPVVASHFGAAGDANGWMSRDAFVGLMCFLLGAMPSLALWGMTSALRRGRRLRIPDAAYWLADARRAATQRWLRGHFALFCAGLPVFLGWIFWLVARANRGAPAHPSLDTGAMLASLAVFLGATAVWVAVLNRHFRRH